MKLIWHILSAADRRHLLFVFMISVVAAALEVAVISSVLPFLAVAAKPSIVQENQWLEAVYTFFAFSSPSSFLVALGLLAFVVLLLSNAWQAMAAWQQAKFTGRCGHNISTRLLRNYIAQPYHFFLERNSAQLGKNILSEVTTVVAGAVLPLVQFMTKLIVALAIFTFIFFLEPILACVITVVFGGFYFVIYRVTRMKLAMIGQKRIAANADRFKAASEVFGAIKEIKLLGCEPEFIRRFEHASSRLAQYGATAAIIGHTPRYLVEVVAYGGIILVTLYLLAGGNELQNAIPVLGAYTFAGYRLMPYLQQMFQAATQLRFSGPALENVERELRQTSESGRGTDLPSALVSGAVVAPLSRSIELRDVSFSYPGVHRPILDRVNLWIDANTSIGIVGRTGAGKSTLVDLLVGLLTPDQGSIHIDDSLLDRRNSGAWGRQIGYVPQQIYLLDDTIAHNIALGETGADLDMARIRRVAEVARIGDFIETRAPDGYATLIGERGVRLSGGQRQRIGLARALYRDPSLLVLDEATSALDGATEASVMEALATLGGSRTIIVIAHRLTTLQACDRVFEIADGQVREVVRWQERDVLQQLVL